MCHRLVVRVQGEAGVADQMLEHVQKQRLPSDLVWKIKRLERHIPGYNRDSPLGGIISFSRCHSVFLL